MEFIGRYRTKADAEIAGFLGSQFAYGKIEVFKEFLSTVFDIMGPAPSEFIRKGDFGAFDGLYYRFQKSDDIAELFGVLRTILNRYGGIGPMLQLFYGGDIRTMLWRAREELIGGNAKLTFFFPKPSASSPLKRWNLYLRWMVRKDEIDAGLWGFIPKDRLVVPLDTHIFKIARCLGWTSLRNPSWKAAWEITEALKRYAPEDPLKYDFFLCHKVGIEGGCTGVRTVSCAGKCVLLQRPMERPV